MGMLEVDKTWTSTGSSGGMAALEVAWPPLQSIVYATWSTLATTNSISIQTAPASTGPWVIEASTTISTAGSTGAVFRITGPYAFIRPYLHTASTGAYTIRLIGMG